jgi:DNA-binding CsgD family transcriptional regulator
MKAEAVVAVDGQDRIVLWETTAQDLFGYPASEAVGLRLQDLLDGRDVFGNRLCHAGCWLRETFLSGEGVQRFEIDVRHAGGHRVRVVVDAETAGTGGWSYRFLAERRRVPASPLAPARRGQEPRAFPPLTHRELDVLRLLVRGMETADMARELGISTTTVRNHVQHLLDKLGAHNRLQAVSLAHQHGLL